MVTASRIPNAGTLLPLQAPDGSVLVYRVVRSSKARLIAVPVSSAELEGYRAALQAQVDRERAAVANWRLGAAVTAAAMWAPCANTGRMADWARGRIAKGAGRTGRWERTVQRFALNVLNHP